MVRPVNVEVSGDRVQAAFDRPYKRLGRGAQVKGFRKGKVPRTVLERVYGPAAAEETSDGSWSEIFLAFEPAPAVAAVRISLRPFFGMRRVICAYQTCACVFFL